VPRSDKKKPQTIDAETGKPIPIPRRIDLSSLRDVRLELASVYRRMHAGELESKEATRAAYVLRQIADIIVNSELEQRVRELEDRTARAPAVPTLRAPYTH